jgi:metalloendopeptidase OMA1, mitochondrial
LIRTRFVFEALNMERLARNLLCLLAAAFLVGCQSVPVTGRQQLQLLSEQEEVTMGFNSFREVLKKQNVSRDARANDWVTRVGTRIAAATGKTNYNWEFRVIDDDKQVNAFCLPGGKVAVYTGILPIARDDAGLAVVIGHEVAHAIARHGGERVSQQMVAEGVTSVAAAALGGGNASRADMYAGLLGVGASVGVLLPYSRLQESEADRLGMIFMAKAGYDPHAARDLWVRMAEEGKGKGKPLEILSSHPADANRIRQIEQWIPEAMKQYRPLK